MSGPVVFRTARMQAMDVTLDDAPDLLSHWHAVPPVPEFKTWNLDKAVTAIDDMLRDQQEIKRTCYRMIVRDPENLSMVGYASIRHWPDIDFAPDLGVALNPAYQGKGLGPELLRGLITFAFNNFSAPLLQSSLNPSNDAAWKLNAKCGLRPFCFTKDGFVDGDHVEDDMTMRISRVHFEKYGANPAPDISFL